MNTSEADILVEVLVIHHHQNCKKSFALVQWLFCLNCVIFGESREALLLTLEDNLLLRRSTAVIPRIPLPTNFPFFCFLWLFVAGLQLALSDQGSIFFGF
jgi:hypothetical protein